MIRRIAGLAAVFAPLAFFSADALPRLAAFEALRQQAIRMNTLAANLDTPGDARTLVGLFATNFPFVLSGRLTKRAFLDHLANAEFNAAHDPAQGISEQQVASAWNTYLNAIGAPLETHVTAAEIHYLRDDRYAASRYDFWTPGMENSFAMPALYNTQPDESLAPNCRPLEALLSLWSITDRYDNLIGARERLRRGKLLSEYFRQHKLSLANSRRTVTVVTVTNAPPNP
ncbi:MAG TPA: hypothetical protein VN151_07425, partial [Terracidiphilus sp.]|nr:hypothetical protein [Terracidiphilus sp.]